MWAEVGVTVSSLTGAQAACGTDTLYSKALIKRENIGSHLSCNVSLKPTAVFEFRKVFFFKSLMLPQALSCTKSLQLHFVLCKCNTWFFRVYVICMSVWFIQLVNSQRFPVIRSFFFYIFFLLLLLFLFIFYTIWFIFRPFLFYFWTIFVPSEGLMD